MQFNCIVFSICNAVFQEFFLKLKLCKIILYVLLEKVLPLKVRTSHTIY